MCPSGIPTVATLIVRVDPSAACVLEIVVVYEAVDVSATVTLDEVAWTVPVVDPVLISSAKFSSPSVASRVKSFSNVLVIVAVLEFITNDPVRVVPVKSAASTVPVVE